MLIGGDHANQEDEAMRANVRAWARTALMQVPYATRLRRSLARWMSQRRWHATANVANRITYTRFGPIIINKHDQFIGTSIANGHYWALDDIEYIARLITLVYTDRAISFYDVGANIGTHTLALSRMFEGRIKIRAFEAQRPVFNMLCGTMALNEIDNVMCHLNAVSMHSGETLEIRLPDYGRSNNFGGLELQQARASDNQSMAFSGTKETVTTVSLDSFDEAIHFIKMDIEGMEDQAVKGAMATIRKARPICFIELAKTDSMAIMELFANLDYLFIERGPDGVFLPTEHGARLRAAGMATGQPIAPARHS